MFPDALLADATRLLATARGKGWMIATAESCTGGLIAGLFTEISGASDVFERGFVTYSKQAKMDLLGVPDDLLKRHGAVSAQVARAMAEGALTFSRAHLAVAVSGIAGPNGGTLGKPVGLTYIAATIKGGDMRVEEHRFGDIGRSAVKLATITAALRILSGLV